MTLGHKKIKIKGPHFFQKCMILNLLLTQEKLNGNLSSSMFCTQKNDL